MPSMPPDVSYPDYTRSAEHDLHDRLEIALARVGAMRLTTRWRHDDLAAPYWRLYLNRQDGARIHPRGQASIALTAGRRYLIPPWLHFASESQPQVDHLFCHFDILGLSGALLRALFPKVIALQRDAVAEQQVLALGDRLVNEGAADIACVCGFKAGVFVALGEVFSALPTADRRRLLTHIRRDLPISEAVAWVDAHLAEDLSNASLGHLLGIGSDQCIRLFRRWLGQTPAEFVQERRIAAAARQLTYSDESIDDIAETCGFANRHYFTRVFSRRMGVPPATYRRSHSA
jgi:AraC-like DNA-binding protein